MKVLFLDIDGVVNCQTTTQRHRGFIGIDPYMAFMVGNLVDELNLYVVLSSSWRKMPEGIAEVEKQVCHIGDITGSEPNIEGEDNATPPIHTRRGREIKAWMDKNKDLVYIENYAILDDDSDMMPEQLPYFFQTSWKTGVTKEIIEKIKQHFI